MKPRYTPKLSPLMYIAFRDGVPVGNALTSSAIANTYALHNPPDERRCRATSKHTRKRCRNWALENGCCKYHGGMTPSKAGAMYSKYLTEEEKALYEDVKIGELDDEIRLAKVHLARAVRLKEEAEINGPQMNLSKKVITTNESGKEEVSEERKPFDYDAIIETRMARVEKLERTRKELLASNNKDMTVRIEGGLPRK